MNTSTGLAECQEPLAVKISKVILAQDFGLASSLGTALTSLVGRDCLGVLYKDPKTKLVTNLLRLFGLRKRRAFLGTIWFGNGMFGTNEQNWTINVYGRDYYDGLVKKLADEIASAFGVKVTLYLMTEQPDAEAFLSDSLM